MGTRIELTTGELLFVHEGIDTVQDWFSTRADAPPVVVHPVSAYDAEGKPVEPDPIAVRIEHVRELRTWDDTPKRGGFFRES
jgi:hypothetical protein